MYEVITLPSKMNAEGPDGRRAENIFLDVIQRYGANNPESRRKAARIIYQECRTMTQEDIGNLLGVSQSTVQSYLNS